MKKLARIFIKITGLLPFLLIVKPKLYYASTLAKKEKKKRKEGLIIASNHTSIFDYYIFIYHHPFKVIHTLVSYLVYQRFGLTTLNKIMGNLKVNEGTSSVLALKEAEALLNKHKNLLIFPEGKLENMKGEIMPFKDSVITLAYSTNSPIIPYYIDGKYGLFRRVSYIKGEKIYLRNIINKSELNSNDITYLNNYLKNKINELKRILTYKKRHHINRIFFNPRCFILDLAKFFSLPWLILFPMRVKYIGNKKEIKHVLKDNALIASNHLGLFDPVALSLLFFKRRIRTIAQEELWKNRFIAFSINHAGVIKLRRDSMNHFDIKSILESKEVLEAKGVVSIYPQGHIDKLENFKEPLFGGLAMLSIITSSPIIPVMFLNQYHIFHLNQIIIGDVIYPPKLEIVNNYEIAKYNHLIYEIMYKLLNNK